MKVQTKITLLLLVVVATFIAGLWAFRIYDRQKFARIAAEREKERKQSFEAFLEKNGEPLKTLCDYDAYWDQTVKAIATNDQKWFADNINLLTLEGYRANAVWVYPPAGQKSVYHVKNFGVEDIPEIPIPPEAFEKLFAQSRYAHFFVKIDNDIMEVRGGTVHGSYDQDRDTPRGGYLFVGRLWNDPELKEMAMFSSNQIRLAPANARPPEDRADELTGVVAFSEMLPDWEGKPLAQLVVRNESPAVRELNRSSERLWVAFCVFAVVVLLLISSSLVRWVSAPLRQIMESLKRSDAKPIERLCWDHSEFGELARTTRKFFEQRDNLMKEMEERRATEEALRKSEEELRHSQKMEAVGRLAGGVAHDFNNLLTAIIGYAELIATRNTSNTLAKQNAELIRKAGEQAAALTHQLLAFSRKQILQPKVIDLNELVVEMEKLLRR
ncbi:MAG: hypothetical protein LC642_07255, partial [Verrucomicrobiaceae bacterium]|nr:hypothetical protein [Verrucomicrobiaceae bacterium]